MGSPGKLVSIFFFLFLITATAKPPIDFPSFNNSVLTEKILETAGDADINHALQLTPDTSNTPAHHQYKSGRVFYPKRFKLWEGDINSTGRTASFNTTFDINIFRGNNITPGEGFAFIIAPNKSIPSNSYGQYLGLTNASTDGLSSNKFIAIELDTVKNQQFDPDDNHMGLNINSVNSTKVVSLDKKILEIAVPDEKKYTVWIQYNGTQKVIKVYMAVQGALMPTSPILNEKLNIRSFLNQYSYFGFSGSTGNWTQLNCVLKWNLMVQNISEENDQVSLKIGLGVGISILALLMVAIGWYYCFHKKRPVNDPKIMGALKSLPGTPREFRFKDLNRATNNFDEKFKLGQGGFGVVYKGVLAKENNMEIAVKKFSRENIQGKDDFLSELTIINRLRHKHLVRLVGWCHKNGMLLLVYDYMPKGSLDNHLYGELDQVLSWDRRRTILAGVASALNYLHNEYDQKVVHRDLKASNIMLDSHYNARLGDFGLARALDNGKTSYAENMEIGGVPGTIGYIAPECFHTGKATRESDIYGFGAVVLEVVCGKRPWTKIAGFNSMVDWVWMLNREGRILEAVDERLGIDFDPEEAERLLRIGLACSHPTVSERPKPQTIVQIISGSAPAPNIPPFKPAFVWPMMEPTGDSSMTNYTGDTTPMSSSFYGGSGWTPTGVSQESYTGYSDLYKV